MINPPVIPQTAPQVEEEETKVSQWWISVIIADLIIAGMITAIIVVQKKQMKRVRIDEAD